MNKLVGLLLTFTVVNNIYSGCNICCCCNKKSNNNNCSSSTSGNDKPNDKPEEKPTSTFTTPTTTSTTPTFTSTTSTTSTKPIEVTRTKDDTDTLIIGGEEIKKVQDKDINQNYLYIADGFNAIKGKYRCYDLDKDKYDKINSSGTKFTDYHTDGEQFVTITQKVDDRYMLIDYTQKEKERIPFSGSLTEMNILASNKLKDVDGLFNRVELKSVKGLQNLDISNITDMAYLFRSPGLRSLDVTGLNTSNVTNMHYMFYQCAVGEIVGLDTLDTSKVTDMTEMFSMSFLKKLNLHGFKTDNVTSIAYMFHNTPLVVLEGLGEFDTSKITNMKAVFKNCSNLKELKGLEHFNTSNVLFMNEMFVNCGSLTELNGLNKFITSKVVDMSSMFFGLSKVKELNLSSFDTRKVYSLSYMFYDCRNLETLILGDNFIVKDPNTDYVNDEKGGRRLFDCKNMFYRCNKLMSVIRNKKDDYLCDALNYGIKDPQLQFEYREAGKDGVTKNGYYRKNYVGKK